MIASLPMYTNPATAAATDRFWTAWAARIRTHGIDAPSTLTTLDDYETVWRRSDLLVSQTCGYPFITQLRDTVRLIATPHYDAPGCDGPSYSSWIIVHAASAATRLEDLRGTRVAYNGVGSQSGYNCLRSVIAPLADGQPFFGETHESGGHVRSIEMVADGRADCAAVDAVTYALAERDMPDLIARVKGIATTTLLPGLPFITAGTTSNATLTILRETLAVTLADPKLAGVRAVLLLSGASSLAPQDYEACRAMETDAIAAGYPRLM